MWLKSNIRSDKTTERASLSKMNFITSPVRDPMKDRRNVSDASIAPQPPSSGQRQYIISTWRFWCSCAKDFGERLIILLFIIGFENVMFNNSDNCINWMRINFQLMKMFVFCFCECLFPRWLIFPDRPNVIAGIAYSLAAVVSSEAEITHTILKQTISVKNN